MRVAVERSEQLRFDDGTPVRAASAVTPYRDGHLVVQDDATSAAWLRRDGVERVRVFPPVDGHDVFDERSGTKALKPDVEAACAVGSGRVLLLGSGSSPARTRAALLGPDGVVVQDLAPLYARVGAVLGDRLNLEGACVLGDVLRWFRRGAGPLPSGSVDLPLAALLEVVTGRAAAEHLPVTAPRTYDLGDVDGVPLAVTDAVASSGGRVLLSAAAEDTDDPVEDGPVVGSAMVLLDGDEVVAVAEVPATGGRVHKVEGLALLDEGPGGVVLLAVVDDDDPDAPSTALHLRVER